MYAIRSYYVSGDLVPSAEQAVRGDVAPLEASPDGDVNAADAVLMLRAIGVEVAQGSDPTSSDTWPIFDVITSYSIHYTKLYEILGVEPCLDRVAVDH